MVFKQFSPFVVIVIQAYFSNSLVRIMLLVLRIVHDHLFDQDCKSELLILY